VSYLFLSEANSNQIACLSKRVQKYNFFLISQEINAFFLKIIAFILSTFFNLLIVKILTPIGSAKIKNFYCQAKKKLPFIPKKNSPE